MVYKEKKFVREVHTGAQFTLDQVVYFKKSSWHWWVKNHKFYNFISEEIM